MEGFSSEVFDSERGDEIVAGDDADEGGVAYGEADGREETGAKRRRELGDEFG